MLSIATFIKNHTGKPFCPPSDLTTVRLSPIGYLCNHNCPMCWRLQIPKNERPTLIKDERKHLTIGEYERLFANAPTTIQEVDIQGGGEPLLYPDIDKLCAIIKRRNIKGYLITNGTALTMPHAKALIACAWDEVRFSLNAGSRGVYKKVNGADDFHTVIKNIKALQRLRGKHVYPKIHVFTVLQRDNIDDIQTFIELSKKLKVDYIDVSFLSPYSDKALMIPTGKIQPTIDYLRQASKKLPIKNNIDHAITTLEAYKSWGQTYRHQNYFHDKYCNVVQTSVEISSQGEVVPCCFAYGGYTFSTVKEKTLNEIWDTSRSFRREMAKGKFYPFCYKNCSWELAKKM